MGPNNRVTSAVLANALAWGAALTGLGVPSTAALEPETHAVSFPIERRPWINATTGHIDHSQIPIRIPNSSSVNVLCSLHDLCVDLVCEMGPDGTYQVLQDPDRADYVRSSLAEGRGVIQGLIASGSNRLPIHNLYAIEQSLEMVQEHLTPPGYVHPIMPPDASFEDVQQECAWLKNAFESVIESMIDEKPDHLEGIERTQERPLPESPLTARKRFKGMA